MIPSINNQSVTAASQQPQMPYELSRRFADGDETASLGEKTLGSETSATQKPGEKEPVREAFGDFVGQTLFGSMLSSMRKSLDKPAYFDGGRAEEVFQEQLDQKLVEEISDASADSFVDPMFDLFQLQRRG